MSAQPKPICKGMTTGRYGEPRPCRNTASEDGYCLVHKPKPPKVKTPLPYATGVKCKWQERQQCANPAGASGYCWTHDPAAYERCTVVIVKAGVTRQCLNKAFCDGYCRNHQQRWPKK